MRLQNVAHRGVDWLWPRRVPIGKVTLLVGDPGLGKSLIALDIAARVSTGKPWPDEEQGSRSEDQDRPTSSKTPLAPSSSLLAPKSVLLISAEDDLADTIRPRLEAAGADCSRILAIPSFLGSSCDGGVPREHELQRDLLRLRRLVESLPDCRLLIIDPISAYLAAARIRASKSAACSCRSPCWPKSGSSRSSPRAIRESRLAPSSRARSAALPSSPPPAPLGSSAKTPPTPTGDSCCPMKCNLAARTPGLAYTIESNANRLAPNPQSESYTSPEFLPSQANERSTAAPSDSQPVIRWFPTRSTFRPTTRFAAHRTSAAAPPTIANTQCTGSSRPSPPAFAARRKLKKKPSPTAFVRRLCIALPDLDGKAFGLGVGANGHWFWQLPTTPDAPAAAKQEDDPLRPAGLDGL